MRCVIGEAADGGGVMNVVGVGDVESRGLRRGIVTSAEAVCDSITPSSMIFSAPAFSSASLAYF